MKRQKRKAKVTGRSRRKLQIKKHEGVQKLRKTKKRARKPVIHQAAYNRGFDKGFDDAYNEGYNAGFAQGVEMAKRDNQQV